MSNSNSKTPIAQTPANTTGKARVDFVRSDFDAVIEQKGYRVYHDKVMRCPCRTNQRTDALSSCRNCGGSGYVYINRFSTKMVLQSINLDTKFKEWSEERIGTVKITARESEDISFMDRITVRDAETISSEVLHPKNQNEYEGTPTLYARVIHPIVEIDDIFAFEEVDKKLVKMTHGVDYTFSENVITFNNSYLNWDNFTVSIRYKHNPSFYIIDMVRDVMTTTVKGEDGRDAQVQMPVHAVGRRAHYVLDEENLDGTYLIDNSYEISCLEGVKCPLAPKNLKIHVEASTLINLSWEDVSTAEVNYVVERAGADMKFIELGLTAPNVTTYEDSTIEVGVTYYYRVATREADCQSLWSAIVGLLMDDALGGLPATVNNNATSPTFTSTIAPGETLSLPSAKMLDTDGVTVITANYIPSSQGFMFTASPGADVSIEINGTSAGTTAAGTTYSQLIQDDEGTAVGTSANPSIVSDSVVNNNASTPTYTQNIQPEQTFSLPQAKMVDSDGITEISADYKPTADGAMFTATVCPIPVNEYIRPADWLDLPTISAGEQKVVGLHAVWDLQFNPAALQVSLVDPSGTYKVNWGDGNIDTGIASGVTAEHAFNYADLSSSTDTTRGYRQSIITVEPEGAHEFSIFTTNTLHSATAAGTASGWLDASIVSDTITTLANVFDALGSQRSVYLEKFEYVGTCIATSTNAMFRESGIQFCKGSFNSVTNGGLMFLGSKIKHFDMEMLSSGLALSYFLGSTPCDIFTGCDIRNASSLQNFARASKLSQIGTPANPLILNNATSMNSILYQADTVREVHITGRPNNLSSAFRDTPLRICNLGTMANVVNTTQVFRDVHTLCSIDCTDLSTSIDLSGQSLSQEAMLTIANAVADGTGDTIDLSGNPETISAAAEAILLGKNWTVIT